MIGVFAITKGGLELGRRLIEVFPSSRLHVFNGFKGSVGETSFQNLRQEVKKAFNGYDGLVFIMATGIVVRVIAPFLKDKAKDPAVVVVDEGGRYAISLLSGHLGGANELTMRIAKLIGAKPVITTATDINGLPCIEEVAKRFNCTIEDYKRVKCV
ncbi:MAG: cobalamin biosynthesis protein CbiG, partial [Deltaproteobacteria bacterium]|nr:cobalamin biosynthesis protein CbiG [Deltaproteobacteria bacterium]